MLTQEYLGDETCRLPQKHAKIEVINKTSIKNSVGLNLCHVLHSHPEYEEVVLKQTKSSDKEHKIFGNKINQERTLLHQKKKKRPLLVTNHPEKQIVFSLHPAASGSKIFIETTK